MSMTTVVLLMCPISVSHCYSVSGTPFRHEVESDDKIHRGISASVGVYTQRPVFLLTSPLRSSSRHTCDVIFLSPEPVPGLIPGSTCVGSTLETHSSACVRPLYRSYYHRRSQ